MLDREPLRTHVPRAVRSHLPGLRPACRHALGSVLVPRLRREAVGAGVGRTRCDPRIPPFGRRWHM